MIKISLIIITLFFTTTAASGQSISINEMDVLIGNNWKGELTYLDYSSNEEFSISVEMEVVKIKQGFYSFAYSYPNEPAANSKSKIKITDGGKTVAGNQITKTKKNSDGSITIEAMNQGKDNGINATFYFTYIIGSNIFTAKKAVEYEDDNKRFVRNVYLFRR